MAKVTRIVFVDNLNPGKFQKLTGIAELLGAVRKTVWHQFGSIASVGTTHRVIRDQWVAEKREFGLPARLWKETLRDTLDDVHLYQEAAKVKAREAIGRHTKDKAEQKRLYTLLKYNRWGEDAYLRRVMRKHYKHGQTAVNNQIVLDNGCYTSFKHKGKVWLKMMSLERGKRIAIPLTLDHTLNCTLRLILRDDRLEVHYPIDEQPAKPCGDQEIGIDKGYSEVFVDTDNVHHGVGLGDVLSEESDSLKLKYQRRNKLKAIAEKKPNKANNIKNHNLGRIKLNRRKRKHQRQVSQIIHRAVHRIVDKANTIVCEELASPIKSQKTYGKNQSRRLSGWVKGVMADALDNVSRRRGSTVHLVNAAYTSQVDSRHGVLLGQRVGDRFYCYDGVVLDADYNAALNVRARLHDPEIDRWTPYKKVKSILLERTARLRGVLDASGLQLQVDSLSTESELPMANNG